MVTQRARSAEAKDQRRAALIDAASGLFADADFDAITIARVAEAAGMAKGTAYLYFPTKEALFLELVRAELSTWLAAFIQVIKRQRAANPALAVPKALAKSFAQHPQMRRLLVLQHTVLEPKLDDATALGFKLQMLALMDEATTAIAPKIPGWRREDAQVFVMQAVALVISVTQLSEPSPVIARVLASDARLRPMRIDFEPFMARTLTTLVSGTR